MQRDASRHSHFLEMTRCKMQLTRLTCIYINKDANKAFHVAAFRLFLSYRNGLHTHHNKGLNVFQGTVLEP